MTNKTTDMPSTPAKNDTKIHIAFASLLIVGCSSSDPTSDAVVGGANATTSGGTSVATGTSNAGVASATGGTSVAKGGAGAVLGGAPSLGGTATQGGAAAAHGGSSSSSGGTNPGGGVPATNAGTKATGGASSSGGTAMSNGGKPSGGAAPLGGAATSGGAAAVGGKSAGGTVANAGGAATMGGVTTGGAATTGGVTTGGRATGGSSATGGTRATFRNPLNADHGSDPFMTYYNGKYYLAATTWGTTLTMKSGATIAALKAATPTVIWTDNTASRKGNMWAPEFYLLDNGSGSQRWYHYYTAGDGSDLGTQRPYVLESDGTDPMGPYHFKAQLQNYWAIDTSILKVGSQLYLMFSAWQGSTQNIWIQGMTNPWTVTGARTQLSAPTYAWEQEGTDSVNEGPIALYHEGRTFVTYSASQCASPGYKLGLLELVASNPLVASSWKKSASAVFQSANGNYGTGHNGFFTSPNGQENWLVYHAVPNAAGSCWIDRTTRIQKFAWNADGTPNFGSPLALTTDILVPGGE